MSYMKQTLGYGCVGIHSNNRQFNPDFSKETNKDLNLSYEEQLNTKENQKQIQNEGELQDLLSKIAELEEDQTAAIELIDKLENDNQDLKGESDGLRCELENALRQIQKKICKMNNYCSNYKEHKMH